MVLSISAVFVRMRGGLEELDGTSWLSARGRRASVSVCGASADMTECCWRLCQEEIFLSQASICSQFVVECEREVANINISFRVWFGTRVLALVPLLFFWPLPLPMPSWSYTECRLEQSTDKVHLSESTRKGTTYSRSGKLHSISHHLQERTKHSTLDVALAQG
jgi:hypothetical protein